MLFALGAEDAVNRIRGAAGGFVIVTNLHFAQQTDCEHDSIQPASRTAVKIISGPCLAIIVEVVQEFSTTSHECDLDSGHDAQHSHGTEEVQRTRQIAQQETNGERSKKTRKVREMP